MVSIDISLSLSLMGRPVDGDGSVEMYNFDILVDGLIDTNPNEDRPSYENEDISRKNIRDRVII